MQDVFAAPVAHREEEPSPKRRKSANGNVIPIRSQAGSDGKDSIVLAKVSIDLVSGLANSRDV
jgi:hypothetical protein